MKTLLAIIAVLLAFLVGMLRSAIKDPHPYKYHVVYLYKPNTEGSSWGYGTMTISRAIKVRTSEDVKSMREFVSESNKDFSGVAIMNWIHLK